MENLVRFWWVLPILIIFFSGLVTVSQGYIDVVTMFGKYRRILQPGLNFKIPLLEQIQKRISIQNRSVELEFQADHSIIAEDLDDVYTRMYHTVFHNHLQQLIRVLGLHYNGRGWAIVRDLLEDLIPKSHGLYSAWLLPERKTLPGKCYLRMRISGMYRFVSVRPLIVDRSDDAPAAFTQPFPEPYSLRWGRNLK